jgi:hypothetical protein
MEWLKDELGEHPQTKVGEGELYVIPLSHANTFFGIEPTLTWWRRFVLRQEYLTESAEYFLQVVENVYPHAIFTTIEFKYILKSRCHSTLVIQDLYCRKAPLGVNFMLDIPDDVEKKYIMFPIPSNIHMSTAWPSWIEARKTS